MLVRKPKVPDPHIFASQTSLHLFPKVNFPSVLNFSLFTKVRYWMLLHCCPLTKLIQAHDLMAEAGTSRLGLISNTNIHATTRKDKRGGDPLPGVNPLKKLGQLDSEMCYRHQEKPGRQNCSSESVHPCQAKAASQPYSTKSNTG